MPKSAYRSTPIVMSGYLYTNDGFTGTAVNTPSWFEWLALGQTFYYKTAMGSLTARCEKRRNSSFWYAFRRRKGKLRKVYLGPAAHLSWDMLDRATSLLDK